MAKKNEVSPEVRAVINESVRIAVKAMFENREAFPDDAYKQTLHRLDALRILKDRVEDNKNRLAGMRETGEVQGHAKSIVRFSADGVRADPMEMYEAVENSLEARIAADEEEIAEVEDAMRYVEGDFYYPTIKGRFVEMKDDNTIAGELCCDESTVRRNRSRLVHMIAVKLYGRIAI